MTVSAIVPTYNRPSLLRETLDSVLGQTALPDEILVGDDSTCDDTEKLVRNEFIARSPVPIRYFHHIPPLRESGNVDFLYTHAKGDLILHLHDDDPIYPRCIELLTQPFAALEEVVATFGLQTIIDGGSRAVPGSEELNRHYLRTPDRAGIVDPFVAGAVSMFPNNGFMVRRDAACKIGYSDNGRAGRAADFYFGFRLGRLGRPFYFVNDFTAKARITPCSQSRMPDSDNAYRTVRILLEDCSPEEITPEIRKSLMHRMPLAITIAAQKRDRANAFRWLFSPYYRDKMLSLRWIKRLLLALRP
jgi:glycosyltransferase involved in cell wall biosynthesis